MSAPNPFSAFQEAGHSNIGEETRMCQVCGEDGGYHVDVSHVETHLDCRLIQSSPLLLPFFKRVLALDSYVARLLINHHQYFQRETIEWERFFRDVLVPRKTHTAGSSRR